MRRDFGRTHHSESPYLGKKKLLNLFSDNIHDRQLERGILTKTALKLQQIGHIAHQENYNSVCKLFFKLFYDPHLCTVKLCF